MFKGFALSFFLIALFMVGGPILVTSVTEHGRDNCHMTLLVPCWD